MARYVDIRVKIVEDKGADPKVAREWYEGRYTGEYGDPDHPRRIQFDDEDIVEEADADGIDNR